MTDRLTKLILTVAAMAVTTAQAAEPETRVCPTSPAGCIIYVHPNSVTIWEAPEPFKQVFVGSAADTADKDSAADKDKDGKDLITAIAADGLGNRHLVLSVRQPNENLFGFGEAIIGRGNVLLYNDKGKEVAHLIVEVTPLNGPSHRVTLINSQPGRLHFRLECDASDCYPAFKSREPTAIENRPDGTVRREYAK